MRRAWHSARPRSCVIMMIVMARDSLNSRNEVHDFRAHLTVEVARGSVGQQEPRRCLIKAPSRQSSLLLAAVKFGRARSQSRTQTNAIQRLPGQLLRLRLHRRIEKKFLTAFRGQRRRGHGPNNELCAVWAARVLTAVSFRRRSCRCPFRSRAIPSRC